MRPLRFLLLGDHGFENHVGTLREAELTPARSMVT